VGGDWEYLLVWGVGVVGSEKKLKRGKSVLRRESSNP